MDGQNHKKLSPKQEIFCREYIKDLNGTQAAIRAKYSEKGADVQSVRLLANASVAARIQELMDKRSARIQLDSDDILKELMRLGFCDIREIFDEKGNVKDPKSWPDDLARAISSIEVFEEYQGFGKDRINIGQTKKVKFWDKTKALEMMGRHKKLFTDKIELVDKTGLAERLSRARSRAK